MTIGVCGWAGMMGNKMLLEVTSRLMRSWDWLYPEVDIEITGGMVGEKDCEPDANTSNGKKKVVTEMLMECSHSLMVYTFSGLEFLNKKVE